MATTPKSARSPWSTRSDASTSSAAAIRFSQPTDTVRVPVSRRPMVCGVVGGSQAWATSSRVIPRARRTSLIRVIMTDPPISLNQAGFFTVLQFRPYGKRIRGEARLETNNEQGSINAAASRAGDRPERGAGALRQRPGGQAAGAVGDREPGRIAARLAVRARLRHPQPI